MDVLVELALVGPVAGLLILALVGPLAGFLGLLVLVSALELAGRLSQLLTTVCSQRPIAVALRLGQQRGERARQRVYLVGREHGPVGEMGLFLGEQTLQSQEQRVLPAPLDGGLLGARVHLLERSVKRPAAGAPGGERVL